MKWQIAKITIICTLLATGRVSAQQIDPVLAGTIYATSMSETSTINSTKKSQEQIAAYQAAITANMLIVRDYEKKMHEYLQNASSAVKNAIEIKQAAVLTTEIVQSFASCLAAAKKSPQGLAVVAITNKQIRKTTEEMIGVYSYISSLTLSKEVLLNAVERNLITWNVLYKLRRIKSDMFLLQYQIETYTLADIPRILFPLEYYKGVNGKRIAEQIIRDYSKL